MSEGCCSNPHCIFGNNPSDDGCECERDITRVGQTGRKIIQLVRQLRKQIDTKQAKIDELMLEWCPDEMTPEQIEEWGRNQRVARCEG